MSVCSNFIASRWQPTKCCDCFFLEKEHLKNKTTANNSTSEIRNHCVSTSSCLLLAPTDTPVVDPIESNSSFINQNTANQQNKPGVGDPSNFISSTSINGPPSLTKQIPCRYRERCYRKNPLHFEKYSHPHALQNQMTHSEIVANAETKLEAQQHIYKKHLERVEKQFLDTVTDLQNEKRDLTEMVESLRKEATKFAMYHQHLENALAEELDKRERRELEKQRILEIKRDTPNYWGINAFDQSYREINIHPDSLEFNIISGLLNNTVETHNNQYGTIYGKDPTEFIVTRITRIHSKKLWHEYCFKKVNITAI